MFAWALLIIIQYKFQHLRVIMVVLASFPAVKGVKEVKGVGSSVHTARLPGDTWTGSRGALELNMLMLKV